MHFLRNVMYILVGLFIGAFAFYFSMVLWHSKLQLTTVPNVVGMDSKQAIRILKGSGLKVDLKGSGKVIGTYPRKGMKVYRGRKVEVYCNSFNLEIIFHRMIDVPLYLVEDALRTLNIKYEVTKTTAFQDGVVKSFYVKNNVLYILVGKNNSFKYYKVPNVRNKTVDDARALLRTLGIDYVIVGSGKIVVDQFPEAGAVYNGRMKLILR